MRLFKMKFKLKEDKHYKIGSDEFYDYGTVPVSEKDLFDTNRTGMSFYDNFLENPEYMEKSKNLKAEIVMMSPEEYFEECAKIFKSTSKNQIAQTSADKTTIEFLNRIISISKKKFPLPFLNYAQQTQEGRHRMYVAAMLTSWDIKFPVLVVTHANEQLATKQEQEKLQKQKDRKVQDSIDDALLYKYLDANDIFDQIEYNLAEKDGSLVTPLKTQDNGTMITVEYDGGKGTFNIDDVQIKIEDNDIEIDNLEDMDIDKWLNDHGIKL